jgi:hypothetical protein
MIPIPWGIALKGGLGFIKRFWPAIVVALAVAWIAAIVIERNSLRDQVASMKVDLKASRAVVGRCQKMTVVMGELETANLEWSALMDSCLVTADAWETALNDELARPPVLNVQIADQVVGDTAETMAATGARIASELAEGLRDRLDGGGP